MQFSLVKDLYYSLQREGPKSLPASKRSILGSLSNVTKTEWFVILICILNNDLRDLHFCGTLPSIPIVSLSYCEPVPSSNITDVPKYYVNFCVLLLSIYLTIVDYQNEFEILA
jgi:hypothetical protein